MKGMKVALALTADLANVDGAGKLNILGVFGRVNARAFPYTLPSMMFVAVLRITVAEFGFDHEAHVKLIGEDGKEAFAVGPIHVTKIQVQDRHEIEVPLIFRIDNLVLPVPGRYHWAIVVDNHELERVPMSVVQRSDGGKHG